MLLGNLVLILGSGPAEQLPIPALRKVTRTLIKLLSGTGGFQKNPEGPHQDCDSVKAQECLLPEARLGGIAAS